MHITIPYLYHLGTICHLYFDKCAVDFIRDIFNGSEKIQIISMLHGQFKITKRILYAYINIISAIVLFLFSKIISYSFVKATRSELGYCLICPLRARRGNAFASSSPVVCPAIECTFVTVIVLRLRSTRGVAVILPRA